MTEANPRWYLIVPLAEDADTAETLAEHPGGWLLDAHTGQMVSQSGWRTAQAQQAPAA